MKAVMREVLLDGIWKRMGKDDSIFFLTADFGSPTLDRIRSDFKDRFFNVGIAEQNLINVSTGLALEGAKVFAYAIAPFITMRAYEQIRVNLSLHAQVKTMNVNLIGVGAGLSYEVSGPTHHCVEDLIIMRALPNFVVFSPSDFTLAGKFVDYALDVSKPKYIRLDGKAQEQIYDDASGVNISKGFHELVSGEGVCIVSTGYMTHTALDAVKTLSADGIKAGLVDVFLLKGLDEDRLFEALKGYDAVVTVEEGFKNKGGLDSLVANILSERDSKARLRRIGFGDAYVFEMGDRKALHKLNSMDEASIVASVKSLSLGGAHDNQ